MVTDFESQANIVMIAINLISKDVFLTAQALFKVGNALEEQTILKIFAVLFVEMDLK